MPSNELQHTPRIKKHIMNPILQITIEGILDS